MAKEIPKRKESLTGAWISEVICFHQSRFLGISFSAFMIIKIQDLKNKEIFNCNLHSSFSFSNCNCLLYFILKSKLYFYFSSWWLIEFQRIKKENKKMEKIKIKEIPSPFSFTFSFYYSLFWNSLMHFHLKSFHFVIYLFFILCFLVSEISTA